jgi:hypothetical protein
MDVLFAFIHFIHASIPFFCCSGVEFFIIFSNSAPEAIYNTMNFFIGSSLGLPEIDRPEPPFALAMAMFRYLNPRSLASQLRRFPCRQPPE